MKQNLLPDNDQSVVSPVTEGLTLTISLGLHDANECVRPLEPLCDQNGMVIRAVRVLLGTRSSDRTPRSFRVMGRSIDVAPNSRGWNGIILDRQELALSIRSGFVTIEFDESHSGTRGPYVDAIEVYASNRRNVEHWSPFCTVPTVRDELSGAYFSGSSPSNFDFSLECLAMFKKSFPRKQSLRAEKLLIKQVIQESAFSIPNKPFRSARDFLDLFEFDDTAKHMFHDKAILGACGIYLKRCGAVLRDAKQQSYESLTVLSLLPTFRSCLKAAAQIARTRPFNYLQVADEWSGSARSIAFDASRIVSNHILTGFGVPSLIDDLVSLVLLESAVTNGSPRGRFGSLDGIRNLLLCKQPAVVEILCRSISRFCRQPHIFESQPMSLGYVCDSCLCVLEDKRFSCEEGTFDLCPSCFQQGKLFTNNPARLATEHVVINGKTVGDSPKLTCGELRKMALAENDCSSDQRSPQLGGNPTRTEQLHDRQLFDSFMGGLSNGLTDLLTSKMHASSDIPTSLLLVCVDIFHHTVQTGRDTRNAKKILSAFVQCLSTSIEESLLWSGGGGGLNCIFLLEGIGALLAPRKIQRDIMCGLLSETTIVGANTEELELVNCRCQFPAIKLVATSGWDSDRPFYACNQKKKCGFFQWADAKDVSTPKGWFSGDGLGTYIWDTLSESVPSAGNSVVDRLCDLVNELLDLSKQSDVIFQDDQFADPVDAQPANSIETMLSGVVCSYNRLENEYATAQLARDFYGEESRGIARNSDIRQKILEGAFQFLALTAAGSPSKFIKWLPVLARVGTSGPAQMGYERARKIARQVLIRCCGLVGSQETMEFFAHGGRVQKLYVTAQELFGYCRIINDKAYRSRERWNGEQVVFSQLSWAELMGVHLLVSEDVSSIEGNSKMNEAMTEIISLTTKAEHSGSWARFCGSLSTSHSGLGPGSGMPPLKILFAIACSASPANQSRALRLIHAALKSEPKKVKDISADVMNFLYPSGSTPNTVMDFSFQDCLLFSVRFVLLGHSSEIRALGCKILLRICSKLDKVQIRRLFKSILHGPLFSAGTVGKRSVELYNFTRLLLEEAGPQVLDMDSVTYSIQSQFEEQLLAIRHGRQNCEYISFDTRSGSSLQKKRYELSNCNSCKFHVARIKIKHDKPAVSSSAVAPNSHDVSRSKGKTKLPPEQITAQVRGKFGMSKENSCCSEFAAYYALGYRIALYSIHLEIENARKYVKTIKVYFTPRPVKEVGILKSTEYSVKWQHCGTFHLNRGCSTASIDLEMPVIAANLMVEYCDFYDRPGAMSKSSDAKTISCPRCSGEVNVAHGVCSSCGEAAFQCRKCRHINYDRLDAFLCVECGYSASASFHFELTAGMATSAIAITNDDDLIQATRMLKAAKRCYNDYKCATLQKLQVVLKGKDVKYPDNLQHLAECIPTANASSDQAGFAKLRLSQLGKTGSVVKLIARPDRIGEKSPVFATTRQSRSNSSRRSDGVMIRGLGGDGEEETASELLSSLLESGGLSRYASNLDSGDPLSRLLASVTSRQVRANTEHDEAGQSGRRSGEESKKKEINSSSDTQTTKESIEVCDRLYALMIEAEREMFELGQRIAAWERLVQGQLGVLSFAEEFVPCQCSQCSPTIAVQLLLLWLKAFLLDPNIVRINEDFVSMLFRDDGGHHLKETKRSVLKEIALKSEKGRNIVLEGLRNRLVLLQDVASAEILRAIMEEAGHKPEGAPFVALAKELLTKGVDGHKYRFS